MRTTAAAFIWRRSLDNKKSGLKELGKFKEIVDWAFTALLLKFQGVWDQQRQNMLFKPVIFEKYMGWRPLLGNLLIGKGSEGFRRWVQVSNSWVSAFKERTLKMCSHRNFLRTINKPASGVLHCKQGMGAGSELQPLHRTICLWENINYWLANELWKILHLEDWS